jgi:CRISPR-associated protein (Cas_APE2256)
MNATGGFKAEIAYAMLVGLLFDAPIFYIHEAFRDIIEMPPTPIGWDYLLLADYEDFFTWIDADIRRIAELDAQLHGLPQEVRLLLADEDYFTLLSPTGEAFYEAYRERLQAVESVPILLSASAWQIHKSAETSVRQLFAPTLRKLRLRELRISHSDHVRVCDCRVFPKGHRPERVFFFDGEDGNVRVCELARHGDESYERLIDRGVGRDDYHGFQTWHEGGG